MKMLKTLVPSLLCMLASMWLAGCATSPQPLAESTDPLEGFNRGFYDLNDDIDRKLVKPVAEVYAKHTPQEVRSGITNFFDNIGILNTIFNDLLQGKFAQGLSDSGRFVVNSTLGIGGLFDPATAWGLTAHEEDLGQTFGTWGAGEGAYLVVPLNGPNSIRDVPDLVTNSLLNPLFYVSSVVMIPVGVLSLINQRANLLDATRLRDEAALDPYTFTREAYRQKRLNDIYDGNPPSQGLDEFIEDSADDKSVLEIK